MMTHVVDRTEDLRQSVERARGQWPLEEVLQRALLSLGSVVPSELAVAYLLVDGRLHARAAVGALANAAACQHQLDPAAFRTLRRALETRRPAAFGEHDPAGEEPDPYAGVLEASPELGRVAVPLFAGDQSLGVITLVRRASPFSEAELEQAGAQGRTLSLALALAAQADALDRRVRELELHARILDDDAAAATELVAASLSPAMTELVRLARQVADADMPVLLRGEHGTGKEVLGRAIHGWSRRAGRPFVRVGCTAASEGALERELFGVAETSPRGGLRERSGRVLAANHGTLLIDEIGALPERLQGTLLRLLERGVLTPVGADHEVAVDVRIIATSPVDLEAAARAGRFRSDLLFRLSAFPLELPPLRERLQDVPSIAERTLSTLAQRTGRGPWTLSPGAHEVLTRAAWPGNVRELANVLERAAIVQPRGVIEARHLSMGMHSARSQPAAELEPLLPLREAERRHLEAALRRCRGKIYGADGAARLLDLKPTTLQSKLKKHGIDRLEVAASVGAGGSSSGVVQARARAEGSGAHGLTVRSRSARHAMARPSALGE